MNAMKKVFAQFQATAKDEKGQALVEYALIIALIAVLLVASLTGVKDGIASTFTTIVNSL